MFSFVISRFFIVYSSEHEESRRHFTLSISGIGKGISSFIYVRINILFLENYFISSLLLNTVFTDNSNLLFRLSNFSFCSRSVPFVDT